MINSELRTPDKVRIPLKVTVLTTETPHHLYFVRELRRICSDIMSLDLVLIETRPFPYRRFFFRYARSRWYNPMQAILLNPYLNISYKSKQQSQYETERFFPDGDYGYDEGIHVENVRSVNNKRALSYLQEASPDIILIYGTGRVRRSVFDLPKITSINCHGGWLPDYRGSDTNIWAVLNGEYDKMAVALHKVDATFDTGPIYMMERVGAKPDMGIISLRYYIALLATDMCARLLKKISDGGVEANPQPVGKGQYYRFVPWLLKPLADWKLRRYAKKRLAQSAN